MIKGKIEHEYELRPKEIWFGKYVDTSGPEWEHTTLGELLDKLEAEKAIAAIERGGN